MDRNIKSIVYDTALPQAFVDDVRARTGLNAFGHMVWCYDTSSIFGAPHPTDEIGRVILNAYSHVRNMTMECDDSEDWQETYSTIKKWTQAWGEQSRVRRDAFGTVIVEDKSNAL